MSSARNAWSWCREDRASLTVSLERQKGTLRWAPPSQANDQWPECYADKPLGILIPEVMRGHNEGAMTYILEWLNDCWLGNEFYRKLRAASIFWNSDITAKNWTHSGLVTSTPALTNIYSPAWCLSGLRISFTYRYRRPLFPHANMTLSCKFRPAVPTQIYILTNVNSLCFSHWLKSQPLLQIEQKRIRNKFTLIINYSNRCWQN